MRKTLVQIKTQPLGPNQKKWLRMLESGKYRRGRMHLYNLDTDSYCCLGVACRMLKMVGKPTEHEEGVNVMGFGLGSRPSDVAPASVQRHLALYDENGEFIAASDDDHRFEDKLPGTNLIALNDDCNWSFRRIAAFCRRYPGAVFRRPS